MTTECVARLIIRGDDPKRYVVDWPTGKTHAAITYGLVVASLDHGPDSRDPVTLFVVDTSTTPPQRRGYKIGPGISVTIQMAGLPSPAALQINHPDENGEHKIVLEKEVQMD